MIHEPFAVINADDYYGKEVFRQLHDWLVLEHADNAIAMAGFILKNTLNKSYQEMAEHYGTAIIPARPRKPKDKAFVEGSVGVVSTWILAALRNQRFLSLKELNLAIQEKLAAFNNKPFQKKEGSRAELFREEQLFLLPLSLTPFELSVWKVATVQYNYHVSFDKMNYSVPYEYIKQQVDVRLTRCTVEIFFGGTRIASHPRLLGALTSIAQMRAICRRIAKNIYSGTETDLSVGLNRSVTIPPLWCVIFLRCTKWSSRDISPVWRC